MYLAILALLLKTDPADTVLGRYADLMAKTPSFSLLFHTSVKGIPDAVCSCSFERPSRQKFQVDWSGNSYVYSQADGEMTEIDTGTQTYDSFEGITSLYPPRARVSSLPNLAYPSFLLAKDLRSAAPAHSYKVIASDTIDGQILDRVSVDIPGAGTNVHLELTIDSQGRLRRYVRKITGETGKSLVTWNFTDFKPTLHPTLAHFSTPIPLGYVPYALPTSPDPVAVGTKLKLGVAIDLTRKINVDLSKQISGKVSLIAVLGADPRLTEISLRSLDRMGASGLNVLRLYESKPSDGTLGFYYSSNEAIKLLAPPSTPMFVLVDRLGKVTHLWMGIDEDETAAFEKSVLAATKSPGASD